MIRRHSLLTYFERHLLNTIIYQLIDSSIIHQNGIEDIIHIIKSISHNRYISYSFTILRVVNITKYVNQIQPQKYLLHKQFLMKKLIFVKKQQKNVKLYQKHCMILTMVINNVLMIVKMQQQNYSFKRSLQVVLISLLNYQM